MKNKKTLERTIFPHGLFTRVANYCGGFNCNAHYYSVAEMSKLMFA